MPSAKASCEGNAGLGRKSSVQRRLHGEQHGQAVSVRTVVVANDQPNSSRSYSERRLRKIAPSATLRTTYSDEEMRNNAQVPAADSEANTRHDSKCLDMLRKCYNLNDNAIAVDDDDSESASNFRSSQDSSRTVGSSATGTMSRKSSASLGRVPSLRIARGSITVKWHPSTPTDGKATVSPHFFTGHEEHHAKRQHDAERLRRRQKREPDWLAPVSSAFDWDDDDDEDRWDRMVGQKVREQARMINESSARRLSETKRRLSNGLASHGRRLSDAAKKMAGAAVASLGK